jgi:hypothetical protein
VTHACVSLKDDVTHTLVMAILDFIKVFIFECDALGTKLGEILLQ